MTTIPNTNKEPHTLQNLRSYLPDRPNSTKVQYYTKLNLPQQYTSTEP